MRAVQEGETVLHHQEIIRRPNGSSVPVLVNAVAFDSSHGWHCFRQATEPTAQHRSMRMQSQLRWSSIRT